MDNIIYRTGDIKMNAELASSLLTLHGIMLIYLPELFGHDTAKVDVEFFQGGSILTLTISIVKGEVDEIPVRIKDEMECFGAQLRLHAVQG